MLKQGDELDEELDDDDLTPDEEELEYEDTASDDTIYGIPKKFLPFILVGVVVLVICATSLSRCGAKKPDAVATESTEFTEEYSSESDEDFWGDATEPTEATEATEAAEVTEDSTSSDPTITDLKKLGYTGDEIQSAIDNGVDLQTLVVDAQARLDACAKDAVARLSDTSSADYLNLLNNTYLGQYQNEVPVLATVEITDDNKDEYKVYTDKINVNADYEKMPLKGCQLLLKCKIAAGKYVWVAVDPEYWASLPERGNVTLQYTLNSVAGQEYVTDVEVDTRAAQTSEAE